MSQNVKNFRKELAEMFVSALQEKSLDWKKEWSAASNIPVNAKHKGKYKGINKFRLMLVMMAEGYTDPRWATFNQIKDMGYKLHDAKGKGVQVEYWYPYDLVDKKMLTWKEYKELSKGQLSQRYVLKVKYSTVFNASLIEGFPELPKEEIKDISTDELIDKISTKMGVEILNDGGDRAYYSTVEDRIHLPLPGTFFSDYAYNSTALHELAHATGHTTRLNRNLNNFFGSKEYAYEELIAEITSCFMSATLNVPQCEQDINNHKAYVQSWIDIISEKPETLAKAISEAEKATSYMELMADVIQKIEYDEVVESTIEINDVPEKPVLKKKVAGPKL